MGFYTGTRGELRKIMHMRVGMWKRGIVPARCFVILHTHTVAQTPDISIHAADCGIVNVLRSVSFVTNSAMIG